MKNLSKSTLIAFLLSLPIVFARGSFGGISDISNELFRFLSLSWITDKLSATKIGIFIIIFAIIYTVLHTGLSFGKRSDDHHGIFNTGNKKQNKRLSMIVSLAISAISIIFIPDSIVLDVGTLYSAIFTIILASIPVVVLVVLSVKLSANVMPESARHWIRAAAALIITITISIFFEDYNMYQNQISEAIFSVAMLASIIWMIVEIVRAINSTTGAHSDLPDDHPAIPRAGIHSNLPNDHPAIPRTGIKTDLPEGHPGLMDIRLHDILKELHENNLKIQNEGTLDSWISNTFNSKELLINTILRNNNNIPRLCRNISNIPILNDIASSLIRDNMAFIMDPGFPPYATISAWPEYPTIIKRSESIQKRKRELGHNFTEKVFSDLIKRWVSFYGEVSRYYNNRGSTTTNPTITSYPPAAPVSNTNPNPTTPPTSPAPTTPTYSTGDASTIPPGHPSSQILQQVSQDLLTLISQIQANNQLIKDHPDIETWVARGKVIFTSLSDLLQPSNKDNITTMVNDSVNNKPLKDLFTELKLNTSYLHVTDINTKISGWEGFNNIETISRSLIQNIDNIPEKVTLKKMSIVIKFWANLYTQTFKLYEKNKDKEGDISNLLNDFKFTQQ